MKVSGWFPDDPEAFSVLLDEAGANADGDWEEQFVRDTRTRYNQYGDSTFVSDKQMKILNRLASGEDSSR